jgi:hypothetical protein
LRRLYPWIANGHAPWIEDVMEAAIEVGTNASKEVAAVLIDVSHHLEAGSVVPELQEDDALDQENDGLEKKDEAIEKLFACEDRYYRVQARFVRDVEKWLEERASTR